MSKQPKKQLKPSINKIKKKENNKKPSFGVQRYRAIWEHIYKYKIPIGWQIHHIDYNHKNNDIINLCAIPANLHKKFHEYQKILEPEISNLHVVVDFDFDIEMKRKEFNTQIIPDIQFLIAHQSNLTKKIIVIMDAKYGK